MKAPPLNGLYLLALYHEGAGYLLVNKQDRGLMVWDTYMGAVQALSKVEPYLGPLNPEILFITPDRHPGVSDLYLNDFILEVCNIPSVADLRLKEIPGVGLVLPTDKDRLDQYKLHIL